MEEVYFSLGTNLGDRKANISRGLLEMSRFFSCEPYSISDLLETEPWGFCSDNKFINCAVRFDLNLTPEEILSKIKSIEESMGRKTEHLLFDKEGKRIYDSRIIDIDILLYGKHRYHSETLDIPHLLMTKRDFVMIPLRQIVSEKIRLSFHDIFG